ncbi:MAG: hypothetical protein GF328_10395, partial [Candidatus Latescibacteria bacterium]|nr:hypothetical protein [Candidatus Latescibacterota bacterium]
MSPPLRLLALACLLAAVLPAGTTARTFTVHPEPAPPIREQGSARDRAVIADSIWVDSLRYVLTIPAGPFTFGETVQMVFTITNFGGAMHRIHFPTDCHDWFGVFPDSCGPGEPGCESAWAPSMWCNQMETVIDLDPGETEEFLLDWRQHTSEGTRAPSGPYTAYATTYNDAFYDVLLSVPFEIVPYGPEPIQEALDLAQFGDSVLVAPGVYHENLVLHERHQGIALLADGPAGETILDGGGRGSVVYVYGDHEDSRLEGFTIRNGFEAYSRDLEWADRRCGGGISLLGPIGVPIRRCIIRDNLSDHGGGVTVDRDAVAPVIEQNLFLDNVATAEGGGVYIGYTGSVPRSRFFSNTFAGNRAARGAGAFDRGGTGGALAFNNIFYRNEATESGGALECESEPMFNYCNAFWENLPDDTGACSHEDRPLFADPLFCAPDRDDYRLQNGSPCDALNQPVCGQIGAYGIGCAPASVE